jgi:hypothetical protein
MNSRHGSDRTPDADAAARSCVEARPSNPVSARMDAATLTDDRHITRA